MLRRLIDWTITDWALKLTALALAFLLWVTVRADAPGQWSTEIPVRVLNYDADWVVADDPAPTTVTVVFRGPYKELLRTASDRPDVIVPVQAVAESSEVHVLRASWVRMPPGTDNTNPASFSPSTVRLTFDKVQTRLIPIAAPLHGAPATGYRVAGPVEIEPSVVRASGAARSLARIDSLRLPPIDLRDRRVGDTLDMTLDTTGTGLVISPRTVRVYVPLQPILADSLPFLLGTPAPRPRGR